MNYKCFVRFSCSKTIFRDAWLISLTNSLTSVFAGFVVFGTLGMLAHNNGVAVEEVITAGEGLTFQVLRNSRIHPICILRCGQVNQCVQVNPCIQVYPEAITQMPVAPLFSFLFFFMLCLLAMSSIVGKCSLCHADHIVS